jgi:hypothetical protein
MTSRVRVESSQGKSVKKSKSKKDKKPYDKTSNKSKTESKIDTNNTKYHCSICKFKSWDHLQDFKECVSCCKRVCIKHLKCDKQDSKGVLHCRCTKDYDSNDKEQRKELDSLWSSYFTWYDDTARRPPLPQESGVWQWQQLQQQTNNGKFNLNSSQMSSNQEQVAIQEIRDVTKCSIRVPSTSDQKKALDQVWSLLDDNNNNTDRNTSVTSSTSSSLFSSSQRNPLNYFNSGIRFKISAYSMSNPKNVFNCIWRCPKCATGKNAVMKADIEII